MHFVRQWQQRQQRCTICNSLPSLTMQTQMQMRASHRLHPNHNHNQQPPPPMHLQHHPQHHIRWPSQTHTQQQQQLSLCPQQRLRHNRTVVVAATGDDPPPSKEDRANPNKADFSAYWSLKFREFFSKRRQYLELSRKQQESPEIFKKIDEQIRVQEEKLEAARMQARWVG